MLNNESLDIKVGQMVLNAMMNHLPVSYRYFPGHFSFWLREFSLTEYHGDLLSDDPETWKSYLDKFMFWLVDTVKFPVESLLMRTFSFRVNDFEHDKKFESWEQASK